MQHEPASYFKKYLALVRADMPVLNNDQGVHLYMGWYRSMFPSERAGHCWKLAAGIFLN